MIYQIERIDRQGNEIEWREVEADDFDMHDDGSLAFYRRIEDGRKPVKELTVCLLAPGTWGQVTLEEAIVLTDEEERWAEETIAGISYRSAATLVDSANNDQYPVTTSAVYIAREVSEEERAGILDSTINIFNSELARQARESGIRD